MSVTTAQRIAVFDQARSSWGEEAAIALMDMLPFDRDDLATKDDIALVRGDIDREFTLLLSEIDAQFTSFRTEMEARFTLLEQRIETASADLRAGFAEQMRVVVLALVATNLTGIALAFAAARLG